ncbi:TetR/AcrR family transcriptional regulator [Mycolicibacter arupensis]|uniref:TetR/AcrR family transcriptional regulator n=1 Tax=Mycolicibacter arupensis TaxID=342002 RepID=UPI003B3A40B6
MEAREKLVEATRQLLWTRGYTATSPKAILAAAGVGQGSMYHHFAGKEALAAEAIAINGSELRCAMDTDLTMPGSTVERLERYLLRYREVLNGCRFGRLTQDPHVVESSALRAQVDEMFRWMCARLEQVIEEGQHRGEFPADVDAQDLAAMVVAVVEGGYVLARARSDPEAFASAARGAVALLRRAVATC